MKAVYVEQDRCLACRNCQRACFFNWSISSGFKNGLLNIFLDLDKRAIFAVTCLHCEDAPCMEICAVEAILRDPSTNAVVVDAFLCVGCEMCVPACPYGNIQFDDKRHVAGKCDLCEGDPVCVKNCMAGALKYGEVEEIQILERDKIERALEHAQVIHRKKAENE